MSQPFKDYLVQVAVAATTGLLTVLFAAGIFSARLTQLEAATIDNAAAIHRIDTEGSTRARTIVDQDGRRLEVLERAVAELVRQLGERSATEQALLRDIAALRDDIKALRRN